LVQDIDMPEDLEHAEKKKSLVKILDQ
jgi:hypothetical protein